MTDVLIGKRRQCGNRYTTHMENAIDDGGRV
jgi:hypothetical protein